MNFNGNVSTEEEQFIIKTGLYYGFDTEEEKDIYYHNVLNNTSWWQKYYLRKYFKIDPPEFGLSSLGDSEKLKDHYETLKSELIGCGLFAFLQFFVQRLSKVGMLGNSLATRILSKSFLISLAFVGIKEIAIPFILAEINFLFSINQAIKYVKNEKNKTEMPMKLIEKESKLFTNLKKFLGIGNKNRVRIIEESPKKDDKVGKEQELDAFVKQIHRDIVLLTKDPYPGAKKDGEELRKLAIQYLRYKESLSDEDLMQRIDKKVTPKLANINDKPFYDRLNEMEDKIMIKIKNYTTMQKNMGVINDDVESILEPVLDISVVELDTGMKLSLTKSDESKKLR